MLSFPTLSTINDHGKSASYQAQHSNYTSRITCKIKAHTDKLSCTAAAPTFSTMLRSYLHSKSAYRVP